MTTTKYDLQELVDTADAVLEQARHYAGEADEAAAHGYGSPDAQQARAAAAAAAAAVEAGNVKAHATIAAKFLGSREPEYVAQAELLARAAVLRCQHAANEAEHAAELAYELAQADAALIEADQRVGDAIDASQQCQPNELSAWRVLRNAVQMMVRATPYAKDDVDILSLAQMAQQLVTYTTEELSDYPWYPAEF